MLPSDLNLFKVFVILFDERSVSRAAERLAVTQPAVSQSLRRLREAFDDQLFVRSPEGFVPTPLARRIEPQIRGALRGLFNLSKSEAFEPATSDRRFSIAPGTHVASLFLPTLTRLMNTRAPRARLSTIPHSRDLERQLDEGNVDLVMGVFSNIPSRFESKTLIYERSGWYARNGHNLAQGPVSLQDISRFPRLQYVRSEGVGMGDSYSASAFTVPITYNMRHLFARQGVTLAPDDQPVLTIDDILIAMDVVANSDLIALLPQTLVENSRVKEDLSPIQIDGGLVFRESKVEVVYIKSNSSDPGLKWMLNLLYEAINFVLHPEARSAAVGHDWRGRKA